MSSCSQRTGMRSPAGGRPRWREESARRVSAMKSKKCASQRLAGTTECAPLQRQGYHTPITALLECTGSTACSRCCLLAACSARAASCGAVLTLRGDTPLAPSVHERLNLRVHHLGAFERMKRRHVTDEQAWMLMQGPAGMTNGREAGSSSRPACDAHSPRES